MAPHQASGAATSHSSSGMLTGTILGARAVSGEVVSA